MPIEERPFTQFEVWTADEAFLSGTAAEIVPVRELDGRSIGRLAPPGSITSRIIAAYAELARSTGTPIWTAQLPAEVA